MANSQHDLRIQYLYALLQPRAAAAQALLERWDRDNPLAELIAKAATPEEFRSLLQQFTELPIGELAALLNTAIAADKGEENALDLEQMKAVLSKFDAQVGPTAERVQAFAKSKVKLPAPLSCELEESLRSEQVRLERDLATMRARMIKDYDLRLLHNAKVPAETIAAIVRDAPTQDDIDQLTKQLEEIRHLLAISAGSAEFTEQLGRFKAFTNAALELLGPALDPMMVEQLREYVQPLVNPHARRKGA